MGYCKHDGCLSKIETPEQQERHDEVFDGNCSVCGCFSGSGRTHMPKKRHRECGYGKCRGQHIKFKNDADARRHWNVNHCGAEEAFITHDRFGKSLGDEDSEGYYSEAA